MQEKPPKRKRRDSDQPMSQFNFTIPEDLMWEFRKYCTDNRLSPVSRCVEVALKAFMDLEIRSEEDIRRWESLRKERILSKKLALATQPKPGELNGLLSDMKGALNGRKQD